MKPSGHVVAARQTKLVCTIGPATAGRIEALAGAGMDVARINFAHGAPATHAAAARAVHAASAATDRVIGILADLAGPKIRLGELAGGSVELVAGEKFILRGAPAGRGDAPVGAGDATGAFVSHRRLASDLRVGDPVFLADGAVELRVTGVDDAIETEVVRGGTARSRAGVSVPSARLSGSVLTSKDLADVRRARRMGATYLGQSFVRSAGDVTDLRQVLGPDGPAIVAKIETRPAVDAFDAILEVADAVMIARGDLGVEMPYEQVPLLQKQLVRRALGRGVPSIVATQMLESMTAAPRPTRAEASDVANAVFDGADAIMLSAETAIGRYPLEAAEAAGRIAAICEDEGASYLPDVRSSPMAQHVDSIASAAVALATSRPDIQAICCYTRTGRAAGMLSAMRPRVPVIAFSPDPDVVARLALVNAVVARLVGRLRGSETTDAVLRLVGDSGLVPHGGRVVVVSATTTPGSAPNVIGVHEVP
jgi:pyruvate kinase